MDWILSRFVLGFLTFSLSFTPGVFASDPEPTNALPGSEQPTQVPEQIEKSDAPTPATSDVPKVKAPGRIRTFFFGTRARQITTCAMIALITLTFNYPRVRDLVAGIGVDNSSQLRTFKAVTDSHFNAIESAGLVNELQDSYQPGMRIANAADEGKSAATTQAGAATTRMDANTQNSSGVQP